MEKNNKQKLLADLTLFVVAFIWGSGFVSSKAALSYMSPMMLMAIRFLIAAAASGLIFHKHLKKIDRETLKAGCIVGFFLFSAFATQMIGLQFMLAGKQSFLTATYVIMVPFIFWAFKKQRPDRYNFVAAFVMLAGIALLTSNQSGSSSGLGPGDILTLICAFLYACQIVSIDHYSKKHDPIVLTVIQLTFSAVLSVIFVIFSGQVTMNIETNGLLNALYLGLICTFLTFLGQTIAQKYTSSTHAAIIMSLESVFGTLLSILILSESFTLVMLLGCLVIFMGIITAETKWEFLRKKKSLPVNTTHSELNDSPPNS
ncbi:DMT family transporter [Eubacteriaceae bacterium ES3]|nr:DMT family transporter [Eubacteriaceae bacterium ES3]